MHLQSIRVALTLAAVWADNFTAESDSIHPQQNRCDGHIQNIFRHACHFDCECIGSSCLIRTVFSLI